MWKVAEKLSEADWPIQFLVADKRLVRVDCAFLASTMFYVRLDRVDKWFRSVERQAMTVAA